MGSEVSDLTARAKTLIAERKYQEAVRVCRRALLASPDELRVRLLLGMAMLALRRYDEVRAEMLALLRSDPEEPTVHRILGEAYLRSGQADKAKESLRRALELDPHDEIAKDLMSEVVEEEIPTSGTIDRWFDPAIARTEMMTNPDSIEEKTGPVASPEIDPAMLAEIEAYERTKENEPPPMPPGPSTNPPPAIRPLLPGLGAKPSPSSIPPPIAADAGRPNKLSSSLPPPAKVPSSIPPATSDPPGLYARGKTQPKAQLPKAALESAFGGRKSTIPPPDVAAVSPLSAGSFRIPAAAPALSGAPAPRTASAPPNIGGALPAKLMGRPMPARMDAPGPAEDSGTEELDSDVLEEDEVESTMDVDPALDQMRLQSLDDLDDTDTKAHGGLAPLEEEPTRMRGPDGTVKRAPVGSPMLAPLPPSGPYPSSSPPPPPDLGLLPAPSPPSPPAATSSAPPPPPPTIEPPEATKAKIAQAQDTTAGRRKARPDGERRVPIALLIAMIVVPVLAIAAGVLAVRVWKVRDELDQVRSTAHAAAEDGRPTIFNAAIDSLKLYNTEHDLVALRARLMATVTFEHGNDQRVETERSILLIPGEESTKYDDVRLAQAYLELVKGDPDRARQVMTGVTGEGPTAVEAMRVRAWIAYLSGDLEGALRETAAAVAQRPKSPRHVAFHAMLLFLRDTGNAQQALTVLDGVMRDRDNARLGDSYPSLRVARARVLFQSGQDPRSAIENDVAAVLGDLRARAAPSELAWAHLLRARNYANVGNVEQALTDARAALQYRPPSDTEFELFAAETFLNAGHPQEARAELERVERVVDLERLSRLRAEVAIESGNTAQAQTALERAGSSPRASYLRGRLFEIQNAYAEARAAYERAAQDPEEQVRASARLGALDLAEGNVEGAINRLRGAFDAWSATTRTRLPGEAQVAEWYVRALIAANNVDEARRVVDRATNVAGPMPELRAARARVTLASGDYANAVTELQQLVESMSEDPDLWASLGQALRLSAETDREHRQDTLERSHTAFQRALTLRSEHGPALLGMGLVKITRGELSEALDFLQRASAARVTSPEIARGRARILVLQGAGAAAVASLNEWITAAPNDAVLHTLLGRLLTQADEIEEAHASYERAIALDANQAEAWLGIAQGMAVSNKTRIGNRSYGDAMGNAERLIEASGDVELSARRIAIAARNRAWFSLSSRLADDANRAIALDARCSEAHRVLSLVDERNARRHLEAAVAAKAPLAETIAALARLSAGEDQCRLAQRYMTMAPRGFPEDREEMQELAGRCR